jgi:signal transduction histidine kinase
MPEPRLPRVLIVDDNADKIVALEAILLDLDVEIVKAGSGREALRHLLVGDFAVVLLDVRMPGMDGFETAALLRERPRTAQTPIIFVTAFGDDTHEARGYSLRAVDYLLTPVVPEVLRTKVSVLVELYRRSQEVERQAVSLRERAQQLHALSLASHAINSAMSPERILGVAAESARDVLRANDVQFVARVEGHGTLTAVADGSAVRCEVASGGPDADGRWRAADGAADGGGPSPALSVRLVGRDGRDIGRVDVRRGGEPFTQEDEDCLVQLAQMTAIAVENAVFSEAREANRAKDQFLATVSHELRTPLNAMLSWIWMLRRGKLHGEAAGRAFDAIDRGARAQIRLIDDLLDVSRITSGKLTLASVPVRLDRIVDAAAESVLAAAHAKGITLGVRPAPAIAVLGDPDRLQQVVWNLLSNAIKFTPTGGRVDVDVVQAGGQAEIRVADTGQGIAPGFLAHVFEPFRQADGSSARRSGGLGLGLAIVRHLLELHGGSIEARSSGPDLGSTFVARLPLLAAGLDEAADPAGDVAPAGAAEGLSGSRILLVEDEVDARESLREILLQAGAEVTAVGDAAAAFAALTAWHPHLLLCDIGLPGEDGYGLIRRIRALPDEARNVLAVAVTAYAGTSDRTRALRAGFQAHVAKPFEPDRLLELLSRALRPQRRAQPAGLGGDDAASLDEARPALFAARKS